ncbi:flagellar protein FlaG [Nitrosomonas ureae]|uniref:Flagellar protein FlaG n=1 Tax=Nitrosomonas ureae TaxID=44577 RepID=A0A1H5VZ11_9PROT|nr:flagellar protein FlaG [Nitrosomonas ureae]SEF92509.1 flagellar protein FlaG [Nitrosomonas ureae]
MITNSTGSMNNIASLPTTSHPASITNKSSTNPVSNENISSQIAQSNTSNTDQLHEAVSKIEKFSLVVQQNLKFSIDEDSGKTIIKVMDATTDEIVRQIPTEEVIDIARTLSKIHGALFNDRA